jgi:hypothetical protein
MHFVLLWKTWFEGKIDTQWDFVLVDHTREWKPRNRSGVDLIPANKVEDIMASMDPVRIAKFESENVHGLVLSALIDASDTESAIDVVIASFPDAEIMRCIPVLDHMLDEIKLKYMS